MKEEKEKDSVLIMNRKMTRCDVTMRNIDMSIGRRGRWGEGMERVEVRKEVDHSVNE